MTDLDLDELEKIALIAELRKMQETQGRLLERNVSYFRAMQECQKLLCADFGDCAKQLADGEKCACGFEDGPYGNAVPPNRRAEAAETETAHYRRLFTETSDEFDLMEDRAESAVALVDVLTESERALNHNLSTCVERRDHFAGRVEAAEARVKVLTEALEGMISSGAVSFRVGNRFGDVAIAGSAYEEARAALAQSTKEGKDA